MVKVASSRLRVLDTADQGVTVDEGGYKVTTYANGTQVIVVNNVAACSKAGLSGTFLTQCIVDVGVSGVDLFVNSTVATAAQQKVSVASATQEQTKLAAANSKAPTPSAAFKASHGALALSSALLAFVAVVV